MSRPIEISAEPHLPAILILEDSRVDRDLISLLLKNSGFKVTALSTLVDGINHLNSARPDLIVLHEHRPDGLSGTYLARIREHAPNTPIIFVSGKPDLTTSLAMNQTGVAAIFDKPINPKALVGKIHELTNTLQSRAPDQKPAILSTLGPNGAVVRTEAAPGSFAWKHLPGISAAHAAFGLKLLKLKDFRTHLLMVGVEGCPFIPAVRDLQRNSANRSSPLLILYPSLFRAKVLLPRLSQYVLSDQTTTLALTRIDTYSPDQLALLRNLLECNNEFSPYAGRLRVVLSALPNVLENSSEPPLPPALIECLAPHSIEIPSFEMLLDDSALIAREVIDNVGGAPSLLTPEAIRWIATHRWPGDYRQFRRVILVSAAAAASFDNRISPALLETAFAREPSLLRDACDPILSGRLESPLPEAQKDALPEPANPAAPPPPEPALAGYDRFVSTTPDLASPPTPTPPAPTAKGQTKRRIGAYDFSHRLDSALGAAPETPPPTAPVHPRFKKT